LSHHLQESRCCRRSKDLQTTDDNDSHSTPDLSSRNVLIRGTVSHTLHTQSALGAMSSLHIIR